MRDENVSVFEPMQWEERFARQSSATAIAAA